MSKMYVSVCLYLSLCMYVHIRGTFGRSEDRQPVRVDSFCLVCSGDWIQVQSDLAANVFWLTFPRYLLQRSISLKLGKVYTLITCGYSLFINSSLGHCFTTFFLLKWLFREFRSVVLVDTVSILINYVLYLRTFGIWLIQDMFYVLQDTDFSIFFLVKHIC